MNFRLLTKDRHTQNETGLNMFARAQPSLLPETALRLHSIRTNYKISKNPDLHDRHKTHIDIRVFAITER